MLLYFDRISVIEGHSLYQSDQNCLADKELTTSVVDAALRYIIFIYLLFRNIFDDSFKITEKTNPIFLENIFNYRIFSK